MQLLLRRLGRLALMRKVGAALEMLVALGKPGEVVTTIVFVIEVVKRGKLFERRRVVKDCEE